METLALANSLLPDNYPLAIAYIEGLLDTGNAAEAKKITQQIHQLRPNDGRLYRLLGKAEELLGNVSESHRLLAESHVVKGELASAIEQLKIARKQDDKSDFFLSSQIESRLKELEQLLAIERQAQK
jgi:predicted Zn-dependent protease